MQSVSSYLSHHLSLSISTHPSCTYSAHCLSYGYLQLMRMKMKMKKQRDGCNVVFCGGMRVTTKEGRM